MNTHRLRWIARRLSKRNNKWFAALEQSGLSACNFLFSLMIVKVAGVADLGVYSFWFVVCQFMAMLTMGLATRQMVLQLASEPFAEQGRGFRATCQIVAVLQLAQALLLAALVWGYSASGEALTQWLALVIYSSSLNFAELFRQFYYLRSRQRYSFWFSAVSLSLAALGFLLYLASGHGQRPELSAFWFLAFGNGLFVLLAYRTHMARNMGKGAAEAMALCKSYWQHGIPATGGMLVTWMQNQSVTPLLMFMFGPLAVGYYSLARMIVTPVNMVTTGLAKSALPEIRRAFGKGNDTALAQSIRQHCRTSMSIVYGYVILVAVVWLVGRSAGWFTAEDALLPLFAATVLVMILSNYRFWVSQNLVIRMQFGVLLRLGIVASLATVALMLGGGMLLKSAFLVVAAPAVGEILLILTLKNRHEKMS